MQARSKKFKSQTNKHISKKYKLIEREREQDDQEEDLAHPEIVGAQNDYEYNLTYYDDSLSIFRGTIRILAEVKVEPLWWLINGRSPEDEQIGTNVKVKPPWWLINARPPEEQKLDMGTIVGDFNPRKLYNEYERKLVEPIEGYQDLAIDQAQKSKLQFNVRVKQPLVYVDYKNLMKLLENYYEGSYANKEKVSPVVCVNVTDGKVKRINNVDFKIILM